MMRALLAMFATLPQAFFPACLTRCAEARDGQPESRGEVLAGCSPCDSPCYIPTKTFYGQNCRWSDADQCCMQECSGCGCRVPVAVLNSESSASKPWILEWSGLFVPSVVDANEFMSFGWQFDELPFFRLKQASHNQRQSFLSVWTK